MADYDLIGSIAIIKGEGKNKKEKLKQANELLRRSNIKSVYEKKDRIKGRLRTVSLQFVKGVRNTITDHVENGCKFILDVKSCYFSPRLSGERKLIAKKIKRNESVLVMFAGIGVYPIVINKICKSNKIVGIELGRECCKYFKKNLVMNKMENKIDIIQGDVKKKIPKEKFDVVVMARPNLKDSFLKEGLKASKKGTRIYYYAFCHEDKIKSVTNNLKKEASQIRREIRITKTVKAGDIAPSKYRYRIEIRVIK
jgi:tRNA (guanine37-N1)-methyltransferase